MICTVADVYEGEMKAFELDGERVLVAHIEDEWFAVADACSHAEASLAVGELNAKQRTVSCLLHGGVFDMTTGEGLEYPAVEPIKTFKVFVEDGEVYVEVE